MIDYIINFLTIITMIIGIIISRKGLLKTSTESVNKKYDLIKKIMTDCIVNKELAITGLKEMLGISISDDFAIYIIKSPKFYEITNIIKSCHTYIVFNPENKTIDFKNGKKPMRWHLTLFYILFSSPVIAFYAYLSTTKNEESFKSIITVGILLLPFIYGAYQMAKVVNDRSRAIKIKSILDDEAKKDEKTIYPRYTGLT